MSEPILERLSRFTPDAGALDRDALLFAAGRRSARPNRRWIALAALLAGTQALSLALFWLHPASSVGRLDVPVAHLPSSPTTADATTQAPDGPGIWSARQSLLVGRKGIPSYNLEAEPEEQPSPATIMDSGPPLRAFGPPPSSILN